MKHHHSTRRAPRQSPLSLHLTSMTIHPTTNTYPTTTHTNTTTYLTTTHNSTTHPLMSSVCVNNEITRQFVFSKAFYSS